MTSDLPPLQPSSDKKLLRRQLQAERQSLIDRHQRAMHLQEVLRVWLVTRSERSIGLPVIDKQTKRLGFRVWTPGCEMEEDAYGIPKPKDTPAFEPTLLLVPCVGYGPKGVRLGYGGGFYDRTLATLQPRPFTAGLAYSHGFVPWLQAEPHDVPLDAVLTDEGLAWQAPA